MNIKRFDQINEENNSLLDDITENEQKALVAGYNIGDKVYNMKTQKVLTIVKTAKETRGTDDKCTLAAVGAYLTIYKPLPENTINKPFKIGQLSAETNLKNAIDLIIQNSYYSKSELKKIIANYLEKY